MKSKTRYTLYNVFLKRLMDMALGGIFLILVSPVMCIVGYAVFIDSGRQLFFKQKRPGYKSRPFMLIKFRTMRYAAAGKEKPLFDDERLTKFGHFLRSSSLDELPELFNVIRGEMSLVGPRPLLMQYLDRYTPEQMRRHNVKPGITGWAQVNGRNAVTWEEKFKYDVWYVDNWNIWLDLKIILLTIWKIIKREGINQPGHASAEEFMGKG
jgi:lipopolysaccharide/colanic/teichoic acid biosynthesis glycosyltransferase